MQTGEEATGAVQETEGRPVETEPRATEPAAVEAEPKSEEIPKNETARESARKAFAEAEPKEVGDKGQETTPPKEPEPKDSPQSAGAINEAPEAPAPTEEDFRPPNRLSQKEREIFNKMPKELRPSVARFFKEREALYTRAQQELKKALDSNIAETGAYKEVLKHYVGDAHARQLTGPQYFAGLAEAHRKLTDDDPKVRMRKAAEILLDINVGIKPEHIQQLFGESVTNSNRDRTISQDPAFLELQKKYDTLNARFESQEAAPVIAEGLAVADEKDSQGNLLWPELHDDEFVMQRVRPLAVALYGTPGYPSYGAALKGAVLIARGKNPTPDSPQLIPTRPPVASTQNRAQSAAVSVRGKSAVASHGASMPEVPRNESSRDSARIAWGLK